MTTVVRVLVKQHLIMLQWRQPLVRFFVRWASKKLAQHHLRRRPDPRSTILLLKLLPKDNDVTIPKQVEKLLMPVTAVTIGELINLRQAAQEFKCYNYEEVIPDEVINININQLTDLMVLSNGTLVGWNLNEEIIVQNYAKKLGSAIDESYVPEADVMDWIGITGESDGLYLKGEVLVVAEDNADQALLEKAAFAIGFLRSTRLSILENALDQYLLRAKDQSRYLATGKIKTTEHQLLQLTGKLFQLRAKLNLYLELIETPDLYWEEPLLERIYTSVSRALDINPRISILNRKLDYATDELRAFLLVLNEKKSTRLEWIIILLITVEVVFELRQFWLEYQHSTHAETSAN